MGNQPDLISLQYCSVKAVFGKIAIVLVIGVASRCNAREFSLTTAEMEAGEVWKALETVIPEATMQQAIEATQSQAERQRRLPTDLVVALVIGMSLWSQESIVDVLKNLADGWSNQWIRHLPTLASAE